MRSLRKIYSIFILFLIVSPAYVGAQNNTSSPYSVFGIGDLSNVGYGRNLGLGGTGYALRGANYINMKNPASLTSIDSLSVLFETGVFGKLTQNNTLNDDLYFWDGNITHVVLAHRYSSRFMGSYGLMPFSDIGYNFRTVKSVEGEGTLVNTDWIGSGGISKLFYALGIKINKNFSVGGEIAYMYGPLSEQRRTTAIVQPSNSTNFYINSRYSGVSYKASFQYVARLGDNGSGITLGAVIAPMYNITGRTTESIEQTYGGSVTVPVYYAEKRATPISVPMTYGAGASIIWKGKYLLTGDYELAAWGENNSRDYKDQQIFSFGIERLPQATLDYFGRCSYRAGFRYDSGYFITKGYAIDDYSFSVGMGFPLQRSRSTLNLTLEAGERGTNQLGLIRERYTKLTVAFSFHDYWFVKRKFD
jgi:hypothetical protein